MVCGNTRLTITSFDFGSSHLRSAATGSSGGVGLKQCFFWAPLMSFWWNKETAKNVIHFPHPEKNTYLWVCWHIFGHLPTGYSANGIWLTRWEFTCKCCHLEALYLGEDERVCLTPWLCPEVCTTKWNFQIPMGDMSFFFKVFSQFFDQFPYAHKTSSNWVAWRRADVRQKNPSGWSDRSQIKSLNVRHFCKIWWDGMRTSRLPAVINRLGWHRVPEMVLAENGSDGDPVRFPSVSERTDGEVSDIATANCSEFNTLSGDFHRTNQWSIQLQFVNLQRELGSSILKIVPLHWVGAGIMYW